MEITKAQAIQKAQAKAAEIGYSTKGHTIEARIVGGDWEVSFVPSDPDTLGGGLVIVVDRLSGEILSTKLQQ